jgi:hypothetical protein
MQPRARSGRASLARPDQPSRHARIGGPASNARSTAGTAMQRMSADAENGVAVGKGTTENAAMAAAMNSLAAMSITNQGRSSYAPVSSQGGSKTAVRVDRSAP